MIDGGADLALGGVDQTEAQIARRVFDAEEVARDSPVRREHHDRGRVGELLFLGHVGVMKADGAREALDGGRVAGQKMPCGRGARTVVLAEVRRLLLRRELRRLTRVEADGDELELASGVERERAQRPHEAVQHERAEHRTAVVDERQDHRPLPEVLPQAHRRAALVDRARIGVSTKDHAAAIRPILAHVCAGLLGGVEGDEFDRLHGGPLPATIVL